MRPSRIVGHQGLRGHRRPQVYTEPLTGIGNLRTGTSYASGTNYNLMHSVVVGIGDLPTAAATSPELALWYVSGIQVERDSTNDNAFTTGGILIADARTNGWLLHKGGNDTAHELGYSVDAFGNYTTSLADVGNVAFQNAWATAVIGRLQSTGADGIHMDNLEMSLSNFNAVIGNGPTAFAYPTDEATGATQASFETAQAAFVNNACRQIKDAGFYVAVNGAGFLYGAEDSGRSSPDDGTLSKEWMDRWYTGVTAAEVEYWQQNSNNIAQIRSSDPAAAFPNWDGWQSVMAHAISKGLRFHGLSENAASDVARVLYLRGSWMLEWDGAGGCWANTPIGGVDNWNTSMAIVPGQPSGAKASVGTGCWKRLYQNGTIYVNPTLSTQTLDGHSVTTMTALWV